MLKAIWPAACGRDRTIGLANAIHHAVIFAGAKPADAWTTNNLQFYNSDLKKLNNKYVLILDSAYAWHYPPLTSLASD
ncbi:hypothetical protein THAOC_02279 [Thalassiosira oceanica]|uniref:Uncharacterized protein n=1 Tax=Thalassiosira oceanica TaxID=159749 RepID=K0TM85_THAOC|nr:hypothetical protein THAOC_02279 [Thalassiosira oceanica]|eukprot:EJK75981.1 hypothetical protein THAOC_02279 [Thalassiosira oceanica]